MRDNNEGKRIGGEKGHLPVTTACPKRRSGYNKLLRMKLKSIDKKRKM